MDSSDLKGGVKFRAVTSACRIQVPTPPQNGGGPGRNCRMVRVNGRAQYICQ